MANEPDAPGQADAQDRARMAAAVRLSRRHRGRTGTNPSVATLIFDRSGAIVGRGVTALGGRPHAEPIALAEAGVKARGATAYVTLEPCAHHGRTPPCAEALVQAGIARVVGGATDPDERVSGKGYDLLRSAGIEVVAGVEAELAADVMSDYLVRSAAKRPEVILKLAISADGMIGRRNEGQVAITGDIARARVHIMRAEAHAIMVGAGTVRADDPELTCRLPGLEDRSPIRILVGDVARVLHPESRLMQTSRLAPIWLASNSDPDRWQFVDRQGAGLEVLAVEQVEGRVALPELLEDLSQRGVLSVLVEGGARLAQSLLDERLVDRIVLFEGPRKIGPEGVAAPLDRTRIPAGFQQIRTEWLGPDRCSEWIRKDRF